MGSIWRWRLRLLRRWRRLVVMLLLVCLLMVVVVMWGRRRRGRGIVVGPVHLIGLLQLLRGRGRGCCRCRRRWRRRRSHDARWGWDSRGRRGPRRRGVVWYHRRCRCRSGDGGSCGCSWSKHCIVWKHLVWKVESMSVCTVRMLELAREIGLSMWHPAI